LLVAADYPFLDVLWTMLIFFLWVIWFWILIGIIADIFTRHDIGGGKKALWVLFVVFAPFLGILVYLIANSHGMAERRMKESRQAQTQMDDYVRSVAGSGGAAAEIERAKQLLDSGAIDASEYEALKKKALAGGTA
jgi:putative oligomerization/nucleic acid binding protein/phospholipase D-like protein